MSKNVVLTGSISLLLATSLLAGCSPGNEQVKPAENNRSDVAEKQKNTSSSSYLPLTSAQLKSSWNKNAVAVPHSEFSGFDHSTYVELENKVVLTAPLNKPGDQNLKMFQVIIPYNKLNPKQEQRIIRNATITLFKDISVSDWSSLLELYSKAKKIDLKNNNAISVPMTIINGYRVVMAPLPVKEKEEPKVMMQVEKVNPSEPPTKNQKEKGAQHS